MASNRELLELMLEHKRRKARVDFWEYRTYIHPEIKDGWWQREIARQLMQFYEDYKSGKRPKLVIQAPPQHGKSVQIIDFISWLAGKDPNTKTIYTSFSERLGIRANLALQRVYDSDKYKALFPDTEISSRNSVTVSGQTLRNREILEYVGKQGFFRNTTVRGSITGESLDLGVIDDPIRGRADANSEATRNGAWDWFTDDFFTRFSEDAGLLAILTRWHVDDPIGRLIDRYPDVKVLSYPAIATCDEDYRKEGEALFPEHKSLDFLLERKSIMEPSNFEALYQQNPYVQGGEIFKVEYWNYYTVVPKLHWRAIYADTAQKTKEHNDYSVFQHWGKTKSGDVYLLDQVRGKWEAPELQVQARAFWNKCKNGGYTGSLRAMKIEDKVSGTGLIQQLRKHDKIPVHDIQRDKDKMTRALDVVPTINAGFVYLPQDADFLSDFIYEASAFPNGAHDDQIDPMMDAINDMIVSGKAPLRDWL